MIYLISQDVIDFLILIIIQNKAMGIYIEALILYFLLFSSGFAAVFTVTAPVQFSVPAEFYKIIMYYIPSLALIWYLIYKSRNAESHDNKGEVFTLPGFGLKKKDVVSCLIALPGLLITGTIITLISINIDGFSAQITLASPVTFMEWAALCFSCIFAAYLEESYFRFYLLSRREELNLGARSALALSVILFSICHLYAGLWSFLNAVFCGAFLGIIFLRYKSLHGIAIAHALYNIFAFVIYAQINQY